MKQEVTDRQAVRVLRPDSARQALAMARRFQAPYVAGASWLQPVWERRQRWPRCLVALDPGWPGFRGIERSEERLVIGALTTLDELARHPLIHEYLPCLPAFLDRVAGPGVRRLGTVAGNLCAGGDLSALFWALGARLYLVGRSEPQEVSRVLRERTDTDVDLIRAIILPDSRLWRIAVEKLGHRERFSPTRAIMACVHDRQRARLAVSGEGGPGRLWTSEVAVNGGVTLSAADGARTLDAELTSLGWRDPSLRLAMGGVLDFLLKEVAHGE